MPNKNFECWAMASSSHQRRDEMPVFRGEPPLRRDRFRGELRVAHDATWNVDIETAATFSLGRELGERAAELRGLSEYERRANTLRRNALRQLDYERIEAERRRVAAEAAGRHGAPRPGGA